MRVLESRNESETTAPFEAVILAGGVSSRMGRDKAWIEVEGQTLLARQLAVARRAGAVRLWVSGRVGVDYSSVKTPVLVDPEPGLGPMAGVQEALRVLKEDFLLVLAVDMPRMEPALLRRLRAACRRGQGVVPVVAGRMEPLAAFFPRALQARVAAEVVAGRLSMAGMVREAIGDGLVRLVEMEADQAGAFANWNSPESVLPFNSRSGRDGCGFEG